ncbi:unnamed protein product [Trifolium pratense]|uniref:Uncharacterized protein n=1 Tax=Trifolium pratense TaxID=57577 RepID=A0ACB0LPX0_TRIPR|nr:unnamed protein product [Trifolium pratense]
MKLQIKMSNYLVYVLVLFLAIFTLTTARNLKHRDQNLHEEVATGSNGLISYQSPTTTPQTLVSHNYDGPT